MKPSGRRSIRLRGYDYTQAGAYFVTMCTHERECLLGDIENGEITLSEYGRIVAECWEAIPNHFAGVELDAFVAMPNHVHGIIVIAQFVGATYASPLHGGPKRQSLGAIVGSFKSAVTKRVNELRQTTGALVWQRNYYEHIIRNDHDLSRIRNYILYNPARWLDDENNPACHNPT